jgi:ubiquinone biosynthesis protein UbiJ
MNRSATSVPPATPDFPSPVIGFVNHVLGQHAWARDNLRAHAGRTVKVSAEPFSFHWAITPEGLVGAVAQGLSSKNGSHHGLQADTPGKALPDVASEAPFDVSLTVPLSSLPQFALDPDGAIKQVRIEGDAELAQLLGQLVREVRWDAEDDLARVTGGIAAHRMMQGAKSFHAYALDASQRLKETVSAFLLDEDPTLVRRVMAEQFARDVSVLRDDCARLEKRLERLEAQAPKA